MKFPYEIFGQKKIPIALFQLALTRDDDYMMMVMTQAMMLWDFLSLLALSLGVSVKGESGYNEPNFTLRFHGDLTEAESRQKIRN